MSLSASHGNEKCTTVAPQLLVVSPLPGSTIILPRRRSVHQAAAKHLTPCLLELGGKSPTIVSSKANMKRTCERLCWGKFFMNVGQTCIAPDYVLVHKDVEAEFLTSMAATLKKFFGDAHHESEDLSRIITAKHASRLADLLQDRDIEIVCGGKQFDLFMEPTIVRATPDSKCMQEEIFGPILPVLAVDSIEEAVEFIDAREKPLAAYVSPRFLAVTPPDREEAGGRLRRWCLVLCVRVRFWLRWFAARWGHTHLCPCATLSTRFFRKTARRPTTSCSTQPLAR